MVAQHNLTFLNASERAAFHLRSTRRRRRVVDFGWSVHTSSMSSHRDDGADLLPLATHSAPGAPTPGGPRNLAGQVAVVTGAGNAIGAATALALAEQGVDVVLVARREAHVYALAQQVRLAGGRAEVVAADVTDEAQARFAVDRAAHAFGRIDILVNNAGLTLLGPATDTTDWRGMLGGDVLGMVRTTYAALPSMGARGIGRIVTISSVTSEALELALSSIPGAGCLGHQMRHHDVMDSVRFTTMGPDMTTPVPCLAARHRIQPLSCLRPEHIAEAVIFVVRLSDLISLESLQVLSPAQMASLDQSI
ncbi:SDR family NAD(P)-dependent oxidoreductase [Deinococcus marmoris]